MFSIAKRLNLHSSTTSIRSKEADLQSSSFKSSSLYYSSNTSLFWPPCEFFGDFWSLFYKRPSTQFWSSYYSGLSLIKLPCLCWLINWIWCRPSSSSLSLSSRLAFSLQKLSPEYSTLPLIDYFFISLPCEFAAPMFSLFYLLNGWSSPKENERSKLTFLSEIMLF